MRRRDCCFIDPAITQWVVAGVDIEGLRNHQMPACCHLQARNHDRRVAARHEPGAVGEGEVGRCQLAEQLEGHGAQVVEPDRVRVIAGGETAVVVGSNNLVRKVHRGCYGVIAWIAAVTAEREQRPIARVVRPQTTQDIGVSQLVVRVEEYNDVGGVWPE